MKTPLLLIDVSAPAGLVNLLGLVLRSLAASQHHGPCTMALQVWALAVDGDTAFRPLVVCPFAVSLVFLYISLFPSFQSLS